MTRRLDRALKGARFTAWKLAACAALASLGFASVVLADESQWTQQSPSTQPSVRWEASIVYDQNSDRLILFGGFSNIGSQVLYNDVWAYSLSTHQWSQLTPSGTPPPVSQGHVAIYDSARDRMVVCGSYFFTTVYTLSLGASPTWSTLSTTNPPNGLDNGVAIYDPVRDQMVVAGGIGSAATRKLTFSNNQWGALGNLPDGSGLSRGAAVYDPVHQRMLYFGGWNSSNGNLCQGPAVNPSNLAASMDLAVGSPTWTVLPDTPWDPRGEIAAVWDGTRNRVLIQGGVGYFEVCHSSCQPCRTTRSQNEVPYGDVWSMDAGTYAWTQINPTGGPPAARGHHVAAYDPTRDEVTMFGGGHYYTDDSHLACPSKCSGTYIDTYRNDTWSFKPDVTAPAAIALNAGSGCYDHIFLTWAAPGDDGNVGTATAYDARWSTAVITAANFSTANVLTTGAPQAAGSAEQLIVSVPNCGTKRYYAIKARDEAGNWSAISNVPNTKPICPPPPNFCEDASAQPDRTESPALPSSVELAAVPNPIASNGAQIRYGVPTEWSGAEFDLGVFDLVGRRVATLDHGVATPGYHTVGWGLRSQDRSPVARGVYFLRLRLGSTTLTQRLIATYGIR